MLLRDVIAESGPWEPRQSPERIAGRVEGDWRGSHVYMTAAAAKRLWPREGRPPRGAAERLAADIERAVLAEYGTGDQVDRILFALMGSRVTI